MSSVDIAYAQHIDFRRSTVLITGGATGIGLGLTKEFLRRGSKVIIAGRRQQALDDAKQQLPQVNVIQADVTTASARRRLRDEVVKAYPGVNVVVNNAGVLRRVDLKDETDVWDERQEEVDTNISAPVHITSLFLPTLLANSSAASPSAIINISSLYAFAPAVLSPSYSATKAYLHSFTQTSRIHLKDTNVQVYEIVPPLVATAMSGGVGADVAEFSNLVINRVAAGEKEIGHADGETNRLADRKTLLQNVDNYTAFFAKLGMFNPVDPRERDRK